LLSLINGQSNPLHPHKANQQIRSKAPKNMNYSEVRFKKAKIPNMGIDLHYWLIL